MAAGAAVAIAVLIAAMVSYWVVRGQLVGQVDGALKAQAGAAHDLHSLGGLPDLPASAGGPAPYVQIALADGRILPIRGNLALPVDSRTRSVAGGARGKYVGSVH